MEEKYKNIEENLKRIRENIAESAVKAGRNPNDIELMAVTKTVPPEVVNEAIRHGIRLLGENRVQEMCEKYDVYEKGNVSIHFIGHLQTNKIGKIIDKVEMIHSIDSLRLAREVQRQAVKLNIFTDVLIEINIAGEISKSGINADEAEQLAHEISLLPNLRLRGLMTVPPINTVGGLIGSEHYFAQMYELRASLEEKNIGSAHLDVLSMGMSDDYIAAVKHGSTIVRLGSAIFGRRD